MKWKNFFLLLEHSHNLHPEYDAHIWLLHFLFLNAINEDTMEWAESWNSHNIRSAAERSPRDLFFFGQIQHGYRDMAQPVETPEDEHAVDDIDNYGVDWEDLEDPRILTHHRENNDDSEPIQNPFLSRTSNQPQHHLSLVEVPVFDCPLTNEEFDIFCEHMSSVPEFGSREMEDRKSLWVQELALCSSFFSV